MDVLFVDRVLQHRRRMNDHDLGGVSDIVLFNRRSILDLKLKGIQGHQKPEEPISFYLSTTSSSYFYHWLLRQCFGQKWESLTNYVEL